MRLIRRGTGAMSLQVTARRTSGVAPFNVHFDATATTSPTTSDSFRKIWYAWNFGESAGPGVAAWTVGVQNTTRNLANGPIQGHLYETPGTFTAQCIATDGVNTAFWSQSITVQDPDVVYAGVTATVTLAVATPGLVGWTAHGFLANQPVSFTNAGGALPTGLTSGTVYFVSATGLVTNNFQVSATVGGASINFTGSQSGVHTGRSYKTVCYSTSGTFTSAPANSYQVTTSDFNAIVTAMENYGNGFRHLARGGETFDTAVAGDSSSGNWSRDDVTFGAFGTGKPTITTSGACATARASPFNIGRDARPTFARLIIRDVIVKPGGTVMGTEATYMWSGQNVTLVRVTGDGVRMLLNSSVWADYFNHLGGAQYHGHLLNPGLAMWDCDMINVVDGSAGDTSTWAYGAFIYATYCVLQGNKFDINATSTNRSHCLRLPHQYKSVIANNRMQQPANQEHCIKLHSETQTLVTQAGYRDWTTESVFGPSGVTGGWSDYVWFSANDIVGGVNPGLVAIGSPSSQNGSFTQPDVATQVRHVGIVGNKITSGASSAFQLGIMFWAEQGLIANNIFSITTASAGRVCAIYLGDRTSVLGGTVDATMPIAKDVFAYNNSVYSAATETGTTIAVAIISTAINCKAINNILWAPNDSAPAAVSGSSDGTSSATAVTAVGAVLSNNSTNPQAKQVSSPFASSTPASLANFALVGGSYAADAGINVGLQKDINSLVRSLTTPDMGAVEA